MKLDTILIAIPKNNQHKARALLMPESSRQGVGTVLASSNVAASHLLGNYLT